MKRFAVILSFAALVAGTDATEAAIRQSLVPKARPPLVAANKSLPRLLPIFGPPADAVRPRARPAIPGAPVSHRMSFSMAAHAGVATSLMPRPRPGNSAQPIPAASVQTQPRGVTSGPVGAICGDSSIRGRKLSPIPAQVQGCGVADPVEVTEVDGVRLSQPATMDCTTAKALKKWLKDGVKPVVGRKGGGVASLSVASSYSCRTRNSQPGAKISEHGKGKAIDISAVNLNNGLRLTVADDWGTGAKGKMLSQMHKAACGPFGTVLGPKSDQYHQDHLHLDTASYRSGPYCR